LSLSLLIILHELGHFIPAKLKPESKNSIYFLMLNIPYQKKIGETEGTGGWLPLGGYVKFQE
jgi:regulator of sigma E protease